MGREIGYHESAGLQLSIPRTMNLSIYRLSSVDIRLASSVYHQSSSLSVHLYSSLPCLRWRLVDGCCLMAPHLSGVWWDVVTPLLQSVTPDNTLHCVLLLARGCSWRLGVVCHPSLSSSTRGVTVVTLLLRGPMSCRRCATGSISALSPVSSSGWAII